MFVIEYSLRTAQRQIVVIVTINLSFVIFLYKKNLQDEFSTGKGLNEQLLLVLMM